MSDFLHPFAQAFAGLNKDNLERLEQLYSRDALFCDPLHEVRGLDNIKRYFAQMYANVSELRFDFYGFDQVSDGEGYLRWYERPSTAYLADRRQQWHRRSLS